MLPRQDVQVLGAGPGHLLVANRTKARRGCSLHGQEHNNPRKWSSCIDELVYGAQIIASEENKVCVQNYGALCIARGQHNTYY